MNVKSGNALYSVLFSGLGLFSYILLVNFTNTDALYSISAVLFFVLAFNILGYSTLRLSSWMKNQYALYITRRWKIVAVYAAVALLFLLLNYGLLVCAKLLVGAAHPLTFPNGGVRLLITVWLVELVVLGLIIVNKSIQNALQLQQQAAKLQEENNAAHYAALQNQLNPHFLFNSLNTLIAEIEYEPQGAIVFTKNLSNVYRYVLQCQNRPLVTLGEELEFVGAYLFLHEVRLGNCIKWNSDIPDDYIESMLPPLTLQLLVENVLKHNSITASKPMEINIAIENGWLVVSNTLTPKNNPEASGIGLKNLSNRCLLMLGKDITVLRSEHTFTVKIPLQYE